MKRHLGPELQHNDRGSEFVYMQTAGKALKKASDFEKVITSKQIRLPCCDANHRFGKSPGTK